MLCTLPLRLKINLPDRANARGFTLIEVLITVAIASALMALGVPQFTQALKTQQSNSEMVNLQNDMLFARTEAVKEGQYVSICVANSTMSGCGTGTWNSGWIIYANPGGSATATYSSGTDVILRKQPAFTTTDTIATNPTTTLVTFNRDGFGMNLSASTGLLFTLHNSPTVSAATRCLWLNTLGNTVIQKAGTTAASGQGTNLCT
jgi:type IV fimbrial biogenesis protein FimT